MPEAANDDSRPLPVAQITWPGGPPRPTFLGVAPGIGPGWCLELDRTAKPAEGDTVAVALPGGVGAFRIAGPILLPLAGPAAPMPLHAAAVLGVARRAWRDL